MPLQSTKPGQHPARRGWLSHPAKPRLRFRQHLRECRGAGGSGRGASSRPQAPLRQMLNLWQVLAGAGTLGPHLNVNKEVREP